ncbi:MAG: hypothetical protein HY351_00530, partial [Candidatus Omnitrophica bacterium]|nr:hypothetical protein [Candidatus Omnitrophota bacterium]
FVYKDQETGWQKVTITYQNGKWTKSQPLKIAFENDETVVKDYLEKKGENERVFMYFNPAAVRGVDVIFNMNIGLHAFSDPSSKGYKMFQLLGRHRGIRFVDQNGKVSEAFAKSLEASKGFQAIMRGDLMEARKLLPKLGDLSMEGVMADLARGDKSLYFTYRSENESRVQNLQLYHPTHIYHVDPAMAAKGETLTASMLEESWNLNTTRQAEKNNLDGSRNTLEGTQELFLIQLINVESRERAKKDKDGKPIAGEIPAESNGQKILRQFIDEIHDPLDVDADLAVAGTQSGAQQLQARRKQIYEFYKRIQKKMEDSKGSFSKETIRLMNEEIERLNPDTLALNFNDQDHVTLYDQHGNSVVVRVTQTPEGNVGMVTMVYKNSLAENVGYELEVGDVVTFTSNNTAVISPLTKKGIKEEIKLEDQGAVRATRPSQAIQVLNQKIRENQLPYIAPYAGNKNYNVSKPVPVSEAAKKVESFGKDKDKHEKARIKEAFQEMAERNGWVYEDGTLTQNGAKALDFFSERFSERFKDDASFREHIHQLLNRKPFKGTMVPPPDDDLMLMIAYEALIREGILDISKMDERYMERFDRLGMLFTYEPYRTSEFSIDEIKMTLNADDTRQMGKAILAAPFMEKYKEIQESAERLWRPRVELLENEERARAGYGTLDRLQKKRKEKMFNYAKSLGSIDPKAGIVRRTFTKFFDRYAKAPVYRFRIGWTKYITLPKVAAKPQKEFAKTQKSSLWRKSDEISVIDQHIALVRPDLKPGTPEYATLAANLMYDLVQDPKVNGWNYTDAQARFAVRDAWLNYNPDSFEDSKTVTVDEFVRFALRSDLEKHKHKFASHVEEIAFYSAQAGLQRLGRSAIGHWWRQQVQYWQYAHPIIYGMITMLKQVLKRRFSGETVKRWLKFIPVFSEKGAIKRLRAEYNETTSHSEKWLIEEILAGYFAGTYKLDQINAFLRHRVSDKNIRRTIDAITADKRDKSKRKVLYQKFLEGEEQAKAHELKSGSSIQVGKQTVKVSSVNSQKATVKEYTEKNNAGNEVTYVFVQDSATSGKVVDVRGVPEAQAAKVIGNAVLFDPSGKVSFDRVDGTHADVSQSSVITTKGTLNVYRASSAKTGLKKIFGGKDQTIMVFVSEDGTRQWVIDASDRNLVKNLIDASGLRFNQSELEQMVKAKLKSGNPELTKLIGKEASESILNHQALAFDQISPKLGALYKVGTQVEALLAQIKREKKEGAVKTTLDKKTLDDIVTKTGVTLEDVYLFLGVSSEAMRILNDAKREIIEQWEKARAKGAAPEGFDPQFVEYLDKHIEAFKELEIEMDPEADSFAAVKNGKIKVSISMLQDVMRIFNDPNVKNPTLAVKRYVQAWFMHELTEDQMSKYGTELHQLIQQADSIAKSKSDPQYAALAQSRARIFGHFFWQAIDQNAGSDDLGQVFRDFVAEVTASRFMTDVMPDFDELQTAYRAVARVKNDDNTILLPKKARFYKNVAQDPEKAYQYAQDYFYLNPSMGFNLQVIDAISEGDFRRARWLLEDKANEAARETGERNIGAKQYEFYDQLIKQAETDPYAAFDIADRFRNQLAGDTRLALSLMANRKTSAEKKAEAVKRFDRVKDSFTVSKAKAQNRPLNEIKKEMDEWDQQIKVRAQQTAGAQGDVVKAYGNISKPDVAERFIRDELNTYTDDAGTPKPFRNLTPEHFKDSEIRIIKGSAVVLVPEEKWDALEQAMGHHGALAYAEQPERFASNTLLGKSGIIFVKKDEAGNYDASIFSHEAVHPKDPLSPESYKEYLTNRDLAPQKGYLALISILREWKAYREQYRQAVENGQAMQVAQIVFNQFSGTKKGNYLDQTYDQEQIPENERLAIRSQHLKVLREMLSALVQIENFIGDFGKVKELLDLVRDPEEIILLAQATTTPTKVETEVEAAAQPKEAPETPKRAEARQYKKTHIIQPGIMKLIMAGVAAIIPALTSYAGEQKPAGPEVPEITQVLTQDQYIEGRKVISKPVVLWDQYEVVYLEPSREDLERFARALDQLKQILADNDPVKDRLNQIEPKDIRIYTSPNGKELPGALYHDGVQIELRNVKETVNVSHSILHEAIHASFDFVGPYEEAKNQALKINPEVKNLSEQDLEEHLVTLKIAQTIGFEIRIDENENTSTYIAGDVSHFTESDKQMAFKKGIELYLSDRPELKETQPELYEKLQSIRAEARITPLQGEMAPQVRDLINIRHAEKRAVPGLFTPEEEAKRREAVERMKIEGNLTEEQKAFIRSELRRIQNIVRMEVQTDKLLAKLVDGFIPFLDVTTIVIKGLQESALAELDHQKMVIDRSIFLNAFNERGNPESQAVRRLQEKMAHEAVHLDKNHKMIIQVIRNQYGPHIAFLIDEFEAAVVGRVVNPDGAPDPMEYAIREHQERIRDLERESVFAPAETEMLLNQFKTPWGYIGVDMKGVIDEQQILASVMKTVKNEIEIRQTADSPAFQRLDPRDVILTYRNGMRLPAQADGYFRVHFAPSLDPKLTMRYGHPTVNALGLAPWLERQRFLVDILGMRSARGGSLKGVDFTYALVWAIAEFRKQIQVTQQLQSAA